MTKISNDFILKQIYLLSKGYEYRLIKIGNKNKNKYIGSIIEMKEAFYCTFNLGNGNYLIVANSLYKLIEIISGINVGVIYSSDNELHLNVKTQQNVNVDCVKLILGPNFYINGQLIEEVIQFNLEDVKGDFSKSDLLKLELDIVMNDVNEYYKFQIILNQDINSNKFVKTNKGNIYIANINDIKIKDVDNLIQPFTGEYEISDDSDINVYDYNNTNFLIKCNSDIQNYNSVCEEFSFDLVQNEDVLLRHKFLSYKKNLYYDLKEDVSDDIDDNNIELYLNELEGEPVNENLILLESKHGKEISDNLYSFALSLKKKNSNLKIFAAVNDIDKFRKKNIENITLVSRLSDEYFKLLATSKYLLNDVSFPYRFIKRSEQVYINIWRQTQLNKVGKYKYENPLKINNVQKNLMISDFVLFPNDFTADIVFDSYNLNGLVDNRLIIKEPKNMLLNKNVNLEFKKTLGISEEKKVILWVPAKRQGITKKEAQEKNVSLLSRMNKIASKLAENIVMLVKIDNKIYKSVEQLNIKRIPAKYNLTQIFNISDILITDYSPVMFDYLLLNKKVILDLHDYDEYKVNNDLNIDLNTLGFNYVYNEQELINEIYSNEIFDYKNLKLKFHPEHIQLNIDDVIDKIGSKKINKNTISDKKKILIFPGALKNNGITTAFFNLITSLKEDTSLDVWVYLNYGIVNKYGVENVQRLNSMGIKFIATNPGFEIRKSEEYFYMILQDKVKISNKEDKQILKMYERHNKKTFGNVKFDEIIDFSGYSTTFALQLSVMTDQNIHVFIHSNMKKELVTRNNFNEYSARKAYNAASNIAVVNQFLMDELKNDYFNKQESSKLKIVQNIIDTNDIIEKSKIEEGYLTDELLSVLNDDSIKFISIARFTPEKGTVRLVNAFFEYKKRNNVDSKLFLICSPGSERQKIFDMIELSEFKRDIFIFENINPFPILKHMSLLLVSSKYEALPMVIFEALTLNVAVASTDIPGPRKFLEQGYGYIVENSTEGLIEAMQRFHDGEIKVKKNNFDEFNSKSLDDFYKLIK